MIANNLNAKQDIKFYFCGMSNKAAFKYFVDKTELNDYPQGGYEGDIVLIDKHEDLPACLADISNEPIVGFDTETKPSFKKGVINKVSLVQLATASKVYLIRVNKIGFSAELASFFSSQIKKVGIACLDDLKDLNQLRKFYAHNIVDLNKECPKVGFESIGAKKLAALVLDIRISKRQQTSNWEADELTEAQLRYAATDAWICREIYLKLEANRYKLQTTVR